MSLNINVFAEFTPKPEYYDKARTAIAGMVGPTHQETGCLKFELFESEEKSRLCLFEKWADQTTFDRHQFKSHAKAVFLNFETWLQSAPVVHKLHPVE